MSWGVIYLAGRNKRREPEYQSVGFIVSGVSCCCHPGESKIKLVNGELFCVRCQRKVSLSIERKNPVFGSLEELIKSLPFSNVSKAFQDRNDLLKVELEKADSKIKEQERRIMELEQNLQDLTLAKDSYCQKCSELENVVSEREHRLQDIEEGYKAEVERMKGELESSRSDVDAYRRQVESLECRTSDLDQLVRDLKDTNNHSRMELQRNASLDVRDVVSSVMKYAAAVNNKLIDDQDLDSIRMFVDARTEGLFMDLGKEGIRVTRHNRGDELGDGRIEIVEKHTDSPEQDMKVARSNSYGASFRDDLYPMIPESVIVYRCPGTIAEKTE